MATERQIQANRANARLSKGPITETGKKASSQNAIRHGLLARSVVLKAESDDRFKDLLASLIEEFQPVTPNENALVETMAVARWRILRLWAFETATLDIEAESQDSEADSPTLSAALAFRGLADSSQALHLLQRYEAALDRQYSRALNNLLKGRARKADPKPKSSTDEAVPDSPKLRNDPNLPIEIRKPIIPDSSPNPPAAVDTENPER